MYIYDGIGNPEALVTNLDTTAFAYDYDPYGVPTLTEDSGGQGEPINPYQFKGGIHDRSTNWVKFGYRWYSVGTGRFTQRDTLDAPLDPVDANRYTFAGNDPINYSDPLGLSAGCHAIGIGTSLIVGTAVGISSTPTGFGAAFLGAAAGLAASEGASAWCEAVKDAPQIVNHKPSRDFQGYEVNPSNGSRYRPGIN